MQLLTGANVVVNCRGECVNPSADVLGLGPRRLELAVASFFIFYFTDVINSGCWDGRRNYFELAKCSDKKKSLICKCDFFFSERR